MEENKAITEDEKRDVIRGALEALYPQMLINQWKVFGYSQVAHNKWGDDLIPYVYETFLKMNVDKQYEIVTEGELERYLTVAMSMSLKSSTSMFYSQYRKFSVVSDEFTTKYHDKEWEEEWTKKEHNIDVIREGINKLDFYDKFLLTEYYLNGKKAKKIAESTNITPATVSRDIKRALVRLKRHIKDDVDL